MTAAAHVFPNAVQNLAGKVEKWTSTADAVKVALVASGTFNWVAATQAYQTVSDFLTNAGSGGGGALTEVSTSSTGYTRTALTSVVFTTTGLVGTLNAASPISWTATSNWSAVYAVFYDALVDTNDTTRQLIAYWDFGGTTSVVSGGNFTLSINASGIVTFTSS